MKILLEFNPNEDSIATPLLFAQAVIDYWYSEVDFTNRSEAVARANLSETAQHISCYLEAEADRTRAMKERCVI